MKSTVDSALHRLEHGNFLPPTAKEQPSNVPDTLTNRSMHRYLKSLACLFPIVITCSLIIIPQRFSQYNIISKHQHPLFLQYSSPVQLEPKQNEQSTTAAQVVNWTPETCFRQSRSSDRIKIRMQEYASLNTTCVHRWFYTIPTRCFMYASGSFNGNQPGRLLDGANKIHECNLRKRAPEKIRDLWRDRVVSRMIGSGDLRLRQGTYYCDEELPLGFIDTSFSKLSAVDLPEEWYTREEIFDLLKGKVLVFRGNSMTRQVFERVIFYLRGKRSFAEHYAHSYMIYGFSRERDVWDICMDQRFRKCGPNNAVSRAWPNLDDVAVLYLEFTGGPPNKTVAARYDLSRFKLPFEKERVAATMVQETKGSRTEPNWFLARYARGEKKEQMLLKLNPWYKAKLREIGWPSKNKVTHNKPLKDCGILKDAHFMCGIEPRFGANLTEANIVIKMPSNGDCSDPFNLNVAQRLFMFSFDKRISDNSTSEDGT